jgi:hypothetical protein
MYALVPTNHRPTVSQRFHMYGYVLAAAKLNIRHEIWNLQTVRVTVVCSPFAHSVPGPWIAHQVFGNCPAAALSHSGRGTMTVQELRFFCFASVLGCVSWPYTSSLKMSNGSSWQKGRPGAGENYIWPVPEGTDQVSNNCANCHSNVTKCWQVTTRFMQAMHDAHVALGMWSYAFVQCSSSHSLQARQRISGLQMEGFTTQNPARDVAGA